MPTLISVYLIRHAQSEMNVQPHLIGGRSTHSPLTEKGIEQARTLGRFLLGQGIIPSHTLSSPAVRTLETARYALEEMNLALVPTIHDDLHEMSQGEWVGRPRADVYTEEVQAEIARLGKDFKLAGGESMNDVGERMLSRMSTVIQNLPDGTDHTVLVFTHGVAIRCLVSHLFGWTHEQTFKTTTPNTSITQLLHSGKGWELNYFAKVPEGETKQI